MNLPILVFENNDLAIYNSLEQASTHIEIVDVRANLYDAYDINGFLLDISVKQIEVEQIFLGIRWKSNREKIIFEDHYPAINFSKQIHSRLLEYLVSMKYSKGEIENLSLLELARMVGKYMPWRVTFP